MTSSAHYGGLQPASATASRAAKGASKKRDTKPELILRSALRRAGLLGYRVDPERVVGRPDIAFPRARVLIFCDGDFWHGRDLAKRLERLQRGHNAAYWVAKIQSNVARDRRNDTELTNQGWLVLRYWESAILADPDGVASDIQKALAAQLAT